MYGKSAGLCQVARQDGKQQGGEVKNTKLNYIWPLLVLCGCNPTPEETTTADAQALVDSITYVRAKNGLCFGVGTVSRISSGGHVAINQMIVSADCMAAGFLEGVKR